MRAQLWTGVLWEWSARCAVAQRGCRLCSNNQGSTAASTGQLC